MPSRRSLEGALATNLEPVPTKDFGRTRTQGKACSFAHLLNLIWLPVIDPMELCEHQPAPQWTEQLGLHHSALLAEMAGYAPGDADTPMSLNEWVGYMKATLMRLLQVCVCPRPSPYQRCRQWFLSMRAQPLPMLCTFSDLGCAGSLWVLHWQPKQVD